MAGTGMNPISTVPSAGNPSAPMAGSTGMVPVAGAGSGTAGSGAGSAGMGAAGAGVPPGTSGIVNQPINYNDPELECYELRAHQGSNLMQPYMVGVVADRYIRIPFDAPWDGTVYARSFRVLTDNAQVIHHWLFYDNTSGGQQLVHGWAPGGSDAYFTPDIGMQLKDGAYSIEYHYNSQDPSATDASGVEVCVTPTAPEHVATISWLGTDAIFGASASGTCDPTSNERVRIIGATPHMHLKGTHMKVVKQGTGGDMVLHDMPFDFDLQRGYPSDIWVEPGEKIVTTCTYNAPSTFGPGTNDEMCYWFAVHYPANGLVDGGGLGSAIHGPNTCLGL